MSPVSVIIPTYNRLECLKRAVASVQAQSFTDWQLWIVDDGSTDGTAGWVQGQLRPHDSRIHFIRTENKGVSHARNRGWEASDSPWVAFLDSDDEWLPKKLELQLQAAEVSGRPLIHTDEIWIRHGRRVNPMKKHKKSGGRIFSQCLPLCCISPSTVMLRRDLFDEPPFREDYPVCEDYELWLRLCAQYEVEFIAEPLIKKFGGHQDQLSRQFVAMDYWRVKAMSDHLENPHISEPERLALREEILRKSHILLQGYEKHGNKAPLPQVQRWREQAEL